MSKIPIKKLETLLRREKRRLKKILAGPETVIEADGFKEMGEERGCTDAGTDLQANANSLATRRFIELQLEVVNAAFDRIEKGTYGICKCGQSIAPDRLKAAPWTDLCIDCAKSTSRSIRSLQLVFTSNNPRPTRRVVAPAWQM